MGAPKGLLDANGVPLVVRHVEVAARVSRRVIVVVGADAPRHRAVLAGSGAWVVENADWASTWPIDSLRCGIAALGESEAAFVAPVDTPPGAPATLTALLAAGGPSVPVDRAGRPGHPVLLDVDTLQRVRGPAPDGLRGLLIGARRVPVEDPDVARDADTPADWSAWGVATQRWSR